MEIFTEEGGMFVFVTLTFDNLTMIFNQACTYSKHSFAIAHLQIKIYACWLNLMNFVFQV